MAYEFTNAKVGSVILQHFNGSYGTTLKFDGVNAQISDANVIIGAMKKVVKRNLSTIYLDLESV